MQKAQIRTRKRSNSDIHIAHCDCTHCDGLGQILDPFTLTDVECPGCEGMGYLEPATQDAYDAYLSDLYKDVVRDMPKMKQAQIFFWQPENSAA